MPSTRRSLLARFGAVLAVSLAGCSDIGEDGTLGPGCDGMHSNAIEATHVSDVPRGATPIRYADLPKSERDIVRPAIDEGRYEVCTNGLSDAERDTWNSFANRAAEHANDDHEAFLARDGDAYSLFVKITDQVYAG